ncbi:Hypothetical protein CGLY_06415 [Corynebacterium glyciniphilum AJ 3170]|uniref:Uncharacterized protein n=1 Tax=Corynebacterium glyciniphilum AJ 3170 TaxID=1404245 RepID=X5DKT9_9CORY|nr:hypothetical protein [Corynebacterium glyciniphilum]AHW63728.1 Hypothetical protein CGLY_06415 [Corynebacterium glyciniphilum AJ 3170]
MRRPAETCGYYDDNGNPIWFDKETGETSPRYYDDNGNPTMEPPGTKIAPGRAR